MKKLKVYGWQGHRYEIPGFHKSSREIVAARSQAEAARLAGYARPSQMFNLTETTNEREVATAMAQPGTVLWCKLDDSFRSGAVYTPAAREGGEEEK